MDESALLEDVVFLVGLGFTAGAESVVGGVALCEVVVALSLALDFGAVGGAVGDAVGGAFFAPASCAIMKHKKMQGNMWTCILTWICAHANRPMHSNFSEKFRRHSHCNLNRAAFRVAFPQENHYEIRSHERVIHRPTT
jgi:hypothetical protein